MYAMNPIAVDAEVKYRQNELIRSARRASTARNRVDRHRSTDRGPLLGHRPSWWRRLGFSH